MTRRARVLNNGILAGILEETKTGFRFTYDTSYLGNPRAQAISLVMPKRELPYESETLFPFFHGLLAEGVTKDLQCSQLKIDERDYFGRLLKTAGGDTIGSILVEKVTE